jgi:hypothetical protein
MELIDWGSPENAAEADTGDRDEAIAIARATVNELTNSGEMVIRGAASAAHVAALLMRGNDTDVHEVEAVVDRFDGCANRTGVCRERHLAVAAADSPGAGSGTATATSGTATATWPDRLITRGTSPGQRPCHDGGQSGGLARSGLS